MAADLTPRQAETLGRVRGHLHGYADSLAILSTWEGVRLSHPKDFIQALREDARALEELTEEALGGEDG